MTTNANDPLVSAEISKGLVEAMVGININIDRIPTEQPMARRSW